ncbi:hypothetical protein LB505_003153 [Fusarium chuoi]|nr:hypothetical protein LB505_003153 [Fusarium chuoi]
MCLVVLQYLPGRPEAHMIFHDEPGPENTTTWSHAAVSRIIKSLRQLFQSFEGSECFDEQVADVLCRNTSKPVNDTFVLWAKHPMGIDRASVGSSRRPFRCNINPSTSSASMG